MKSKLLKALTSLALALGVFISAMPVTAEAAGNDVSICLEDSSCAYSLAYIDPSDCDHENAVYEGSGTRYKCANSVYHWREYIEIFYCGACNSDLHLVIQTYYEEHDLTVYSYGNYTARCVDCNYVE